MNMATLVLQMLLGLVFLPLSFLALRQHETDWYGTFLVASGPFASSAMVLASQKLRERCFETETTAKDLIPTGNAPCNGSCQRDCVGSYPSRQRCCAASAAHSAETSSTTDCVRQARPQEVLRASDPTQPPVLQRFATASSQQNPPAHSSGRISSNVS